MYQYPFFSTIFQVYLCEFIRVFFVIIGFIEYFGKFSVTKAVAFVKIYLFIYFRHEKGYKFFKKVFYYSFP